MREKLIIFLSLVLLSLGLPSATHAATDGCPDTWVLKFEPNQKWMNQRGAMGVSDFPDFFTETTGTLERNKKELGNNIAVGYQSEFSKDKTNWVPLKWPMKLPNDASSYSGPGRTFSFLHPGYTRGVYTVETKDCKNPGVFYTDLLKTYEIKVNKDNFKIEDAIPKDLNFKAAAVLTQNLKDELKSELSNYQETGIIAENYPNDESVLFIVPKTIGCLDYVNWKWKSKGKSCDVYVYFRTSIFNSVTANNNYLTGWNYNIVEEITLPAFQEKIIITSPAASPQVPEETIKVASMKKIITCIKGKITKKVSAVKPTCPVGYKKK